ncbi:uncharacterized protein [Rutidosis leptorrhynchoides]|uniref:uncharacterized protein n=1 Tax=Rutidosis leptorrhynchoides TaxID=125765 RepID=UPI003A98F942
MGRCIKKTKEDAELWIRERMEYLELQRKEEEKEEEREIDRRRRAGKLLGGLSRPTKELIIGVQNHLPHFHGLVVCLCFHIIYYVKDIDWSWKSRMYLYTSDDFVKYYDAYDDDSIQDGSGGLAHKAHETYQTYFSTKIKKGKLKDYITDTVAESCCCLGMCLKTTDFGSSHDYVFEMIFKLHDDDDDRQPFKFLDSLFLKLDTLFPSLKLSSGAQSFGGGLQSLVIDFDTLKAWEPLYKIKRSSVSASVEFAHLKTEFSQLFHPVSSNNAASDDIDYRLTYFSFQFSRPLWIQLESDQDLMDCINHCKIQKITQLSIRVLPCRPHIDRLRPFPIMKRLCLDNGVRFSGGYYDESEYDTMNWR